MKTPLITLGLATLLALAPTALLRSAEPAASAAPAGLDQKTLDKRTAPILKDLALGDAAKEAAVRAILEPHFQALHTWHEKNDAGLKALWNQWAEARSPEKKNDAHAATVSRQIDETYATFRPQHDAFLAALKTVLASAQIDAVKDSLTKSPGLKRTYDAYLQIVPQFTEAQKTFVREKLEIAREQAMDAQTNKEKADLFKKQKIQVEAYIDAAGYDWKKSYAAFVAKLNGKNPPEKPAPEN